MLEAALKHLTVSGMKLAMVVAALLAFALFSFPQTAKVSPTVSQETQVRGYWIDSSTGLMWTAKDNGKDVSRKGAAKYCQTLRIGGYSDWRLATLDELKGIYDENANSPGRAGKRAVTWYVKGNLYLTGHPWSSNYRSDDRGSNSGYSWFFNFNNGQADNDPSGFPYPSSFMRALCVRGSGK